MNGWYEKFADDKPRVSTMPYLYDIAEGNVANHTTFSKMGYNGAVDGATAEDLWPVGGAYVPPTGAMGMEVYSANANDTAAGTGAQQVTIYYLTTDFTEKTEAVELNGGVAATTALDIYRVNHFVVTRTGANKTSAGDIDIRHVDDTPIYSRISAGFTRGRNSFYTVPKNKVLFITSITFSAGAAVSNRSVRFITRATYDKLAGVSRDFFLPFTEAVVEDAAFFRPLEMPTKFIAGVDLKISAISADGATYCSSQINGWLENA